MRFAPHHKLVIHSQFADYLAGESIYPIGVEISPSGVCNATCQFCFFAHTDEEHGGHHKSFLDYHALLRVLGECSDLGVKAITWTGGGEPTLHPSFPSLVELTFSSGLKQGLFTNALARPAYRPERMEWIRITMTDKPFKTEYIKMLRPAKTLGFAFNYGGEQDKSYLEDTIALAEVVKADYVQVRPALNLKGQTTDIEPPDINHPLVQITSYKFEDAKHRHGYSKCEGYHFVPYIRENGDVDVCSYMMGYDGYSLGNIYKDSFKDIMDRSPKFVLVHPHCQVCCKNHEINKEIDAVRHLEDVDFP